MLKYIYINPQVHAEPKDTDRTHLRVASTNTVFIKIVRKRQLSTFYLVYVTSYIPVGAT